MPSKSVEDKILPRRFDLIKMMYSSDRVTAANKKDLILNWFFEQFGNYQDDKSSYLYQLFWKTFHEILVTEKKNNSGYRVLIKSNAVINLLDAITDYPYDNPHAYVILQCVAEFLQTPSVNATLIADIDLLLKLLVASLIIICKIYGANCNDTLSLKEATYLANVLLDILENLPNSNDEDRIIIFTNSLKDIATFIYIAPDEKELNELSEKLAKKMINIIFNLKTKYYESLLTPIDTKKEDEKPNMSLLKFFLSLRNLLASEEASDQSISMSIACSLLMKKLLLVFLSEHKHDLHSLKVTALFFAVTGLDIPILSTAHSCCNSLFKEKMTNADINIIGLSYLLEACSTTSRYFTSMMVPEGYIRPSAWLKGVSAALLVAKINKNKSAWLRCFQSLLVIAPSILESDILPLIKMALLNISVHSTESKKQYCELFHVILEAHSQLHQIPKFFVKLLLALTECIKENTYGKFLANGQVLPQIQESVAKCVKGLPHGQMIELWKVFIETFSTLEIMSQVFNVSKCFMFFVAQLFSTFLLHAQLFQTNIPSNVHSRLSSLIESTAAEIKKNVSVFKDTDSKVAPFQKSLLLLSYAVGEVKLAYIVYYEQLPDKIESSISDNPFNFSILHSFLNEDYASVLESYLSKDDKILSVLIFQLLLQKVKALQFKELSTEADETHMDKLISVILEHLQLSSSAISYWDSDMCTINDKNYGTVFWKMFLKTAPLVLNRLNYKDLYALCCSLLSILQDDSSDLEAKSTILSSLHCEFFQESKHFQTAFISALWIPENVLHKKRSHNEMEDQVTVENMFKLLNMYSSNSFKYAQRTPKSSKKSGSMWSQIKELCDLLNSVLLLKSFPRKKLKTDKISDFIKLFSILPMEYLLPGNQMKCIIGLSVMFFLVPQNCKSAETVQLAKEISLVLISIFEGVRSIWLFDFVSSGPYLKSVVNTLEAVMNTDSSDDCEWALQLLEHLFSLLVKSVESLKTFEQYIPLLIDIKKHNRATLITAYALLKKHMQVLQRPYIPEKSKESLLKISSLSSTTFKEYMKSNFRKDIVASDHSLFIKCYVQVIEIVCCPLFESEENIVKECLELVPSVYEIAVEKVSDSRTCDVLSDVYMLFISKVSKYSAKLSSFLPEDHVFSSWKIILSHYQQKASIKSRINTDDGTITVSSDTLNENSCFLCSVCSAKQLSETNDKRKKSLKDEIHHQWSLNEFEQESLKELSLISSCEILSDVFQNILKELGCFNDVSINVPSFQLFLCVFKSLIDTNQEKCQQLILNQHIQKCASHLYYIVNQACGSPLCQSMIVVPVLDFISFILSGNCGLQKHVLLQSLHTVSNVPLHYENYDMYIEVYTASWKIIYNLFMHHTSVVLSSVAAFLPYVGKLLKSIVKAGAAEPLSKCDANTFQHIQLCALNMNRLLTVLTRHKNELSKLAPYLVADYVDTVQHITLESNIKDSIISGIYRLLDICSEESIKMLSVNVNYISREIYANLIKNYRQSRYVGAT